MISIAGKAGWRRRLGRRPNYATSTEFDREPRSPLRRSSHSGSIIPALQLQPRLDDNGEPVVCVDAPLRSFSGPALLRRSSAEKVNQHGQAREHSSAIWKRALSTDRAFRQYDAADPANRLVTGELEAPLEQAGAGQRHAALMLPSSPQDRLDRPLDYSYIGSAAFQRDACPDAAWATQTPADVDCRIDTG